MKKIILFSLLFLPIFMQAQSKNKSESSDTAGISIEIKPDIGIDFIRTQFTPALDLHLTFRFKKHRISLGSSSNFFFDNATLNKPSLYNFITLEERETRDNLFYRGGGVAVLADPWFTKSWSNKQFARNTWKLYYYIEFKQIELSPELIFSGIYCYPGIAAKF